MEQKFIFLIKRRAFLISLLVGLLILPALSFGSDSRKIYVDDDANGTQNGSSNHPYKTIERALSHADKNTRVIVRKGHFKENVEIPEDVEIWGADKDDVVIEAENNDRPTVKMNHKTKLNKVTVEDGRNGIRVNKNGRVVIEDCIVKGAERDGVFIESGNLEEKHKVSILDSTIKKNGRSGVYSNDRKLSIIDSEFSDNEKDGLDMDSGSSAWIKGNTFKNNGASGMKLELDGSEIYTRGNSFSHNKREGVEVEAKWKSGIITLEKSKFKYNGNFGISRVKKSTASDNLFNGLSINSNNEYLGNEKGSVSGIIHEQ